MENNQAELIQQIKKLEKQIEKKESRLEKIIKQSDKQQFKLQELSDTLEKKVIERTRELAIAKEEAEQANKIKSDFLANMSHEIRTPIGGILGVTDILLSDNPSSDQKKYLTLIKESSEGLKNIVNDILDYTKMQAGKYELVSSEFEIKKVFEKIRQVFATEAHAKKLKFEMQLDEKIPDKLLGDHLRVLQILNNLVSNAIKFTSGGYVKIVGSLLIRTNNKVVIKFSVIDSGIGMSEEIQSNLFEAFAQGDISNTKEYQGAGLGLVVAKNLAELMRGKIEFESKEGNGSAFHVNILFPVAQEALAEAQTNSTKQTFKPRTCLIVEDIKINQMVLQSVLKGLNFTSEFANDGVEGVEKAQKNPYDMIFMDIQMPRMDGFEATQKIREFNDTIPIVAVSAAVLPQDKQHSLDAGMNDHVAKPVDRNVLIKAISKF
ncbi:MAG: response regulator [Campylobacterota bacterium]|nr:response regulator [Campylobacterota bacterium]